MYLTANNDDRREGVPKRRERIPIIGKISENSASSLDTINQRDQNVHLFLFLSVSLSQSL